MPSTRDLLSELYNFADDIVVVGPAPLRDYIAEPAEAVLAHYQPRSPGKARTSR